MHSGPRWVSRPPCRCRYESRAGLALVDRLAEVHPDVRGKYVVTRTLACRVPDLDVVFFATLNDDGIDDRAQQDPGVLADMTTRMRTDQPNILEQLLGKSGTGGTFNNPLAKIALAGITAFAAQKIMGARR